MASNVGRQYGQGVTTQIGGKYTPEKAKFFDAWARAEGTAAANNPFATTRSGYAGESNFNRVGVKNYTDVRTGLQATYDTLLNGHYGNIVELLKRDDVTAVQLAQAVADSPWGTGAGVLRVLGATKADAYDQSEQQTAFVAKGAAMLGEQAKQGLNLAPQQTLVDSLTRLGPLSAQQGQRLAEITPNNGPAAEQVANQYGGTTQPPLNPDGTVPTSGHAGVDQAIAFAEAQIGKPYVFGAENPQVGFDCSGLIDWAFKKAGFKIKGRMTTYTARKMGTSVMGEPLQKGDWLITNGGEHMVLYVGNGKVVAAPHTGELVQYQDVSRFTGDIVDVRRIAAPQLKPKKKAA